MFESIKGLFKPRHQDCDCETCKVKVDTVPVEVKEPKLYEIIVTFYEGCNRPSLLYSDLITYKFQVHRKTENLDLELKFKNGDVKQVYFNRGTWFHIEGRNQEIKLADIDQVKAAWEPPIERKLPEFPVTLDSQ